MDEPRTMSSPSPHSFEDLRRLGTEAVQEGRLAEAAGIYERALAFARQHGTRDQLDLAACNHAAVNIEMGGDGAAIPALREILMRNQDRLNAWLAAYTIARFYELGREYKKALFYGRVALDRAQRAESEDWLASSHNLVGNSLLAESQVDEAYEQYRQALELGPSSLLRRGRILDNIGYCLVLQGTPQQAMPYLHESLAILRRLGAEAYEISTRLDLCFAHLELARLGHARRHGSVALRLAEKVQDVESLKNALFLLGETAHLAGDEDTARFYFTRLQDRFFPDSSFLPAFLLSVDIRTLINLHA